jgi:SAM-dependent methyltransferase
MDVETFRALLRPPGQRLLRLVIEGVEDSTALTLGSRLRRDHPPELVAAALTQAALRRKARPKFGPDADIMYFTPAGLEQATGSLVAVHRARRFAGRGRVADLCCGVGGDLVALARAGLDLTGADRDPVTAEVARANLAVLSLGARARVECADVQSYDLTAYDAIFCDPSRRTGRGRTTSV